MAINLADNDPRVSYAVAEGVTQTSFTVSFEFFDEEDLNVYVDGTLKTLTTDYTVTGGDGSTGSVSISVTGATGGSTVVITRSIDLERTTDFPVSGAFNIASLNTELDRFVAINADLKDQIERSLKLTDYDTGVALTLPAVDDRKGTVLAFNSTTGAVEAGPTTSNVNQLADIADDIGTLADIEDGTDATDAIQTVAGISSNVTTVAGISANVTTVAGISANVTAVAGDEADIGTVAGSISNVNTVATNISDVNTAATNITDIQNASTNAATATTKASEAATSATNAATSETNAATSATAAAASAAAAAASADNFDDTYLGAKSSDPTVDNDGDALNAGDLYFNTTSNTLKVYSGSAWQDAAVDASGFIGASGGTLTGALNFGDNVKAQFGASNDLEIYHDGSHSYIKDAGTGDLILQGSDQVKIQTITGETMVSTNENNAVVLYYDNDSKLATASTGIDVTGELIADSYNETYAAVTSSSNATTVDCHNGNAFSHTLTENTTFTFSNPPASGTAFTFSLEIIQDASASGYTVTWPSSVDWPSATAPTLTATASAKDVFVFYTRDGGTTFYGFTAGQALG